MAIVGQRKDPIKLLWKRLALLSLFGLVCVALAGVWGVYWKERESGEQRRISEAQLLDLTQRQTALAASIKALDTDRGKEQALRGAYAVGREGEGLVVIVDQAPATAPQSTSSPMQWIQKFFWH